MQFLFNRTEEAPCSATPAKPSEKKTPVRTLRSSREKRKSAPKSDAGTYAKPSQAVTEASKKKARQNASEEEEAGDEEASKIAEEAVHDLTRDDGSAAENDVYFPVKPLPAEWPSPMHYRLRSFLSKTEPGLCCAVPEFGVARGRIFGRMCNVSVAF